MTPENRVQVLEHLNALNQTSLFGRFHLDADRSTVVLQHDLLGDDLQTEELINALYTVGVLADQADDQLLQELGSGTRAADLAMDETVIEFFDDSERRWHARSPVAR